MGRVGVLSHFDGQGWADLDPGAIAVIGLGGSSSTDVWAVGAGGHVVRLQP